MPTTKILPKDAALQIIQDQPADSTIDDLIRELIIYRSIQRGIADSKAGRTMSLEELKRRMDEWRK